MLLLPSFCHVWVFLFDYILYHYVDLQVGKARFVNFLLAENALALLFECLLKAFLAEGMSTGCCHWLVHQLPADCALEFFVDND